MSDLGHIQIEQLNRSTFLARGMLAAGAAYGALAVAPFVERVFAQAKVNDIDILNYALTLEYLEATFYERALQEVDLSSEARQLIELVGKHESDHVDALISAVEDQGGTPVPAPGLDFGDSFSTEENFLDLSIIFEDTGVSAYNGAAPLIESPEVLASAGTIVQIEARHAAAIRMLVGEDPAPASFEEDLPMGQVMKAVTPFIV